MGGVGADEVVMGSGKGRCGDGFREGKGTRVMGVRENVGFEGG